MESEIQKPKVGVGIMIFKDGKILLGKRRGAHGDGEFSFPGGHLEHLESFVDCAHREIAEEAGIKVKNMKFLFLANVTHYNPKHYVHIGLTADWDSGEPQILEPELREGWDWYELERLPSPLFYMCKLSLECYKTGKNYLDISDIEKFEAGL